MFPRVHRHHHHVHLPGGVVLAISSIILLAWGLWDAVSVGALYFRGERATGIVISRDEGRDDTRIRVGEAVCPVYGDQGRVGRPVTVVHPRGRPGECIVRRPEAFKWAAGAILFGGGILAVWLSRMRAAASPERPTRSAGSAG